MAKHDLYRNSGGPGYLLDVQTDLLDELTTRIVVPLSILGSPVGSLADDFAAIKAALDMVFQGF